jgi:hypothetical protein
MFKRIMLALTFVAAFGFVGVGMTDTTEARRYWRGPYVSYRFGPPRAYYRYGAPYRTYYRGYYAPSYYAPYYGPRYYGYPGYYYGPRVRIGF